MTKLTRKVAQSCFIALLVMTGAATGCDEGAIALPTPTQLIEAPFLMSTPVSYPTLPPLPTPTGITPIASQTLNGIRVGVQPVQADAHRVTFAYSVDGPALPYRYGLSMGDNYNTGADTGAGAIQSPSLTALGKIIPLLPGSDGLYPPTEAGKILHRSGLVSFDGASLRNIASPMQVQLSLPIRMNSTDFPPMPVPTTGTGPTETPTQVPPASQTLLFALSLPVPFDSRLVVVPVNSTIESNQVQMTLHSVEITASEARFTLRYKTMDKGAFTETYMDAWSPSASLRAASGAEVQLDWLPDLKHPESDGICPSDSSGAGVCNLAYHGQSLLDKTPAEYTLHVQALGPTTDAAVLGPPPVLGEWVFHFTVPAVPRQ